MNDLSEEELKEIKYCIDIWKKGIGYDNPIVYVKPFEKLLDLYNKEKEKNKELIEGQLETLEKILLPELMKKYISKDKIREKIKEYDGLKEMDLQAYEEQIKPLLELLEEE